MPRKTTTPHSEAPLSDGARLLVDDETLLLIDDAVINTISGNPVKQEMQAQILTTDRGTLSLLVPALLTTMPGLLPAIMKTIADTLETYGIRELPMGPADNTDETPEPSDEDLVDSLT